ncbi:hypothetical protein JQ633_21490 [Bradyrhizobium tropiciagri]|uniref:hypothetical protein n=1 Tax=Bradyrhizobium tropiciagri TaxID=312253 RepID=UPI001BA81050|nr:hypothetical protein [Bradyrhizobium tropiciagri]MBR0872947.1 hypothetical protein [Bradyrhizobium tropiciagri]
MRLDTRTILIALVIFNVIAIGMSEVQRRALVENSLSSQTEFARQAAEWSKQQADVLVRTSAQLDELTARVNKIEIQTLASGEADRRTQEIYDRVLDMQKTLAEWKASGPAGEHRR